MGTKQACASHIARIPRPSIPSSFYSSALLSSAWLVFVLMWNQVHLSKRVEDLSVKKQAVLNVDSFPVEVRARSRSWLPIIVGGDVAGGLGNQVEIMLEQIAFIRKHGGVEYVVPAPKERVGGKALAPDEVWNFATLRKIIKKVHKQTPAVCDERVGGRWDVVIKPSKEASSQWQSGNEVMTILNKTNTATGTVSVRIKRYGMESFERGELQPFLAQLVEQQSTLSASRTGETGKMRTATCVYLGIHAFPPSLENAKFLQPSPKYFTISMRWPLRAMAVIHLRYDEEQDGCAGKPPVGLDPSAHVCTFNESSHRERLWIPRKAYVQKLSEVLRNRNISFVYLTKSPYIPTATWDALRKEFDKVPGLKLTRSAADDGYTGEELNYVERALATRSAFFVAEARSTWSSTAKATRSNDTSTITAGSIFRDYSTGHRRKTK